MRKFINVRTIVDLKMYKCLVYFSAILSLLPISCKIQNTLLIEKPENNVMELLVRDDYSGMIEEQLLVFKNEKSLKSFYAIVNRTRKPGLAVPKVDFNKNMLVVWCSGEIQSADVGLVLKNETDDFYKLSRTNPDLKTKSSAIISPFMVYKLPLSNKKIVIE